MSPVRRRGTAQAGFPEDRGVWVAAAVGVTTLVGWLVVQRGAYGGPISGFGAGVRTAALVLLAAVPLAALAWAWKRISRRTRQVAPIPIGVLVVFLMLLAVAHSGIYLERMRMGRDPAAIVADAFGAGDQRFWAVQDSAGALLVPPVANRCIVNRYGSRVIPGTEGMTVNAAHRRYRSAAAERAEAYNRILLRRLEIPDAVVALVTDGGGCPD
jgi:hypothetical protein